MAAAERGDVDRIQVLAQEATVDLNAKAEVVVCSVCLLLFLALLCRAC